MRALHFGFRSLLVSLFLHCTLAIGGSIPRASLHEIAQRSDLIFIGTVTNQSARFADNQKFILTDVVFDDLRIVHAGIASKQHASPSITLTFAGGTIGDRSMSTSAMPRFRTGARYLVFMRDDGDSYVNPVVGGPQGKFEIVRDASTGADHLLSASGRGMLRSTQPEPRFTRARISAVSDGIPQLLASEQDALGNVPVSTPHDQNSSSERFLPAAEDGTPLMVLGEFVQQIRDIFLTTPLGEPVLKFGGVGNLHRRSGNEVIREDLRTGSGGIDFPRSLHVVPAGISLPPVPSPSVTRQATILGGTLGYAGSHTLKLVMEQVPKNWWTYGIQNDCMWTWNQFVDVYRYTDDDGTYRWQNSSNEFVGFITDEALYQEYSHHWNGYIAMVCTWQSSATGDIYESDLMFNAAYNWTPNAEIAIGDTNVISIRPVAMHELGHTWGEQIGDLEETYDYDVPSVMHSSYAYIVEDGWGIHAADAKLFRENYQSQSPPTSVRDVGVESYRASDGLINSAIVGFRPYPGSTIELQKVTIENMSNSALSDVRIRFYLSIDRTITTTDYQLGSYWSWASFPAESHTVESYKCTIPESVPPGVYYVGAIVTIDGFNPDDYPYNNTTSFLRTLTVYEPITIGGQIVESVTAVPLSNVEMVGLPGTPLTNAEGRYSVVVPYLWGGVVTPTSSTHSFTPNSTTYWNVASSQVTGYAGTLNTVPVSGYVLTGEGLGIAGTTMTGLPSPPVTAANGAYVRMVPTGWSGVVRPVKPSHRFSPDSVVLTNVTSLQSCWFTGTKVEFTITGQISIGTRQFLEGVVMNGLPGSPVTNVSGYYSAVVDSGWSGTAIPTKPNYIFSPPSVTYVNVTETPSTKLSSYSAQLRKLSVSGYVRTAGGAGIDSVTMNGLPRSPLTDSTGHFSDSVSFFWNGSVQPLKAGYSFTPYTIYFSKLVSDTVLAYVGIGPPLKVRLTVASYPSGLTVKLDDSARVGPYSIQTLEGSTHTVSADSVLSTGFGSRARWVLWWDGRARTHTVVPTRDTVFVAIYTLENEMRVSAVPEEGGTTQPAGSRWWLPTMVDTARAFPNAGYRFQGWEGDILSSENPLLVPLDRPKAIVARFEPISGIAGKDAVIENALAQSYPNPFNALTVVDYQLLKGGPVRIAVYDALGREVTVLVDGEMAAGRHTVRWEASGMASGVYYCRMRTGEFVDMKKILLAR